MVSVVRIPFQVARLPGNMGMCHDRDRALGQLASCVQMSPSSVSTVRIFAGSAKIRVLAFALLSSTLCVCVCVCVCVCTHSPTHSHQTRTTYASLASVSSINGSSSIASACRDVPPVAPSLLAFFCSSRSGRGLPPPPPPSLRRFLGLELAFFSGSSSKTSKSSSVNSAIFVYYTHVLLIPVYSRNLP